MSERTEAVADALAAYAVEEGRRVEAYGAGSGSAFLLGFHYALRASADDPGLARYLLAVIEDATAHSFDMPAEQVEQMYRRGVADLTAAIGERYRGG